MSSLESYLNVVMRCLQDFLQESGAAPRKKQLNFRRGMCILESGFVCAERFCISRNRIRYCRSYPHTTPSSFSLFKCASTNWIAGYTLYLGLRRNPSSSQTPVDVLYIVDSYGAIYPEQLARLADIYMNAATKYNKKVGIHAHNNQQLALIAMILQLTSYPFAAASSIISTAPGMVFR